MNEFTDGDDAGTELLRIDQATEDHQRARLDRVKRRRDQQAVERALAAVTAAAADGSINLMPSLIDAVDAYATEEEISGAMEQVFGTYVEAAVV